MNDISTDEPKPGIYKHYKGGTYEVTGLAKHTETKEIMVLYRSREYGTSWCRPLSEWNKPTADGGVRFKPTLCEMRDAP